MEFSDIKEQVQEYHDNEEYELIADMITEQNVRVAVPCTGKEPAFDEIQPLTRPTLLLEAYKQLIEDISNAADSDEILFDFFSPEYIQLSAFGMEYRIALYNTSQRFHDLGYADPLAEAETKIMEDMERLESNQNKKIDTC